jgi:hypothetical protein
MSRHPNNAPVAKHAARPARRPRARASLCMARRMRAGRRRYEHSKAWSSHAPSFNPAAAGRSWRQTPRGGRGGPRLGAAAAATRKEGFVHACVLTRQPKMHPWAAAVRARGACPKRWRPDSEGGARLGGAPPSVKCECTTTGR